MDLSRQLLKDFADVTRGVEREQTQYLRGTIKGSGETKYVRIDGSESLTPISEVVDVKEGDRVLVTIENHEATILGNLTKPPSAYKEQEAIDKAEDAQESAENASNKAENAQTLAKSASDKADAATLDATNASASANKAKQDAAEALTSAGNASTKADEAKNLATTAGQNAATAREEAALAQNAATAAQGEVTRIEGVVTGVKGDIDTALKEVADQAADLQATKETLEVTYAKKTEVSDVQAALTTEISKKVGELQTTVSQTYAAKNDVVAMEGRLQSQITQTSGEVSSVVGKVEQLESDTTEAKKKVDEALEKSAAAQVAAGQAQANATAAQTAADAAKANADNATKKANEAVQNAANAAATAAEADRKVSAAKTDLDEAKVNLENTMNRVGATEQEIADAQKKVDAAQAAVTQAQKEAAEATLAANNAQSAANKAQTDATEAQNAATNAQKKADNAALAAGNAQAAADKAQQDVAALTKRVTSAETAITQNAEQIKLSANKTEEIGTKLDNLKVGSRNLWILNKTIGAANKETLPDNHITGQKECYRIDNGSVFQFDIEPDFSKKMYGKTFTFSAWIKYENVVQGESSWNAFNVFKHRLQYSNSSSNAVTGYDYLTLETFIGTSDWKKVVYTYTYNRSGYDMLRTYLKFNMENAKSGTAWVTGVQVEEGTIETDYHLSEEDQQSQIDGINNNLSNNYYSKTQTDAAIKVAADNVTTTVRKEVTTEITNVNNKVDNIQVGGRNLLKDTVNFHNNGRPSGSKDGWLDSYHSTIESEKYNGLTVRSLKNVTTAKEMCNYYFTGFNLGDTYTLSFWAKGTINKFRCYFYGDSGYVKARAINASIPYVSGSTYSDGFCAFVNPKITNWTRISVTWELDSVGDINIAKRVLIRTDGATSGDLYVCGVKLEKGNKATDWTPAPEDMATADQAQQAQNDANEANGKADATENRVSVAESTIKQLSDSISMLVTDSNGSSMMTQTSNGWTFNIGSITDSLNNAVNNLDNLTGSVEQSNTILNNLKQLADDLSNKTSYINMSTDEITGLPCIELGKGGDPFKVRITNRSVDFMDGESKIAYVSNQTLYINQAVVRNEFMIGDRKGFVFKTRSNGNMGIRWTTMSRIFITRYDLSQSEIDTYSKPGYSKTWGIWESIFGIEPNEIVKIGVINTDTKRYNYIEARVSAMTTTSLTCISTGIVTTY